MPPKTPRSASKRQLRNSVVEKTIKSWSLAEEAKLSSHVEQSESTEPRPAPSSPSAVFIARAPTAVEVVVPPTLGADTPQATLRALSRSMQVSQQASTLSEEQETSPKTRANANRVNQLLRSAATPARTPRTRSGLGRQSTPAPTTKGHVPLVAHTPAQKSNQIIASKEATIMDTPMENLRQLSRLLPPPETLDESKISDQKESPSLKRTRLEEEPESVSKELQNVSENSRSKRPLVVHSPVDVKASSVTLAASEIAVTERSILKASTSSREDATSVPASSAADLFNEPVITAVNTDLAAVQNSGFVPPGSPLSAAVMEYDRVRRKESRLDDLLTPVDNDISVMDDLDQYDEPWEPKDFTVEDSLQASNINEQLLPPEPMHQFDDAHEDLVLATSKPVQRVSQSLSKTPARMLVMREMLSKPPKAPSQVRVMKLLVPEHVSVPSSLTKMTPPFISSISTVRKNTDVTATPIISVPPPLPLFLQSIIKSAPKPVVSIQKKKAHGSIRSQLPRGRLRSIYNTFLPITSNRIVLDAIEQSSDSFFKHFFDDIVSHSSTQSAHLLLPRKVVSYLKRFGYVTDQVSLADLARRYLPAELEMQLIQVPDAVIAEEQGSDSANSSGEDS